jgi:DNA repair protein RecO (recombination protein O)
VRRADRVELVPAFVLHARAHRDTSRIVDCLARDHGRVALVARGVRRPGAALRGVLQPFQPLLLSWVGRGELGTLTGAEPGLRAAIPAGESLFAAFYANELLLRGLMPHDPHPALFDAYATLLDALGTGVDAATPLRRFELALLEELGYGVTLDVCAGDGAPVRPDRRYAFRPAEGVLEAAPDGQIAEPLFEGRALLALARAEPLAAGLAGEARRLTRLALDHALGQRPLRTRAVYRALQGALHGAASGKGDGS